MSTNNNQPLVSIIFSCYNYGEYVGQAIESLLNQTYENIEIIVVENGSTDNSYEVMKQYSDRIKIICLEKNDVTLAGDMLREAASGDYIAFMTADDYWAPEKIENQMQMFAENPKVDACFTWIHTVDEQGNVVENTSHNVFSCENRSRYEWMERLILQGNCFAFPSAVVKSKCYYDILEKHFYQMGDKYLWMRTLLSSEVYVVPRPLTYVRWHPNAKRANMSAMNLESTARTLNEEAIIAEDIITRMDDDFFVQTFGRYMRDANAGEHGQILCEKLFFLMKLAEKKPCFEQAVITFYYKHDSWSKGSGYALANFLNHYYGYTYLDFQKYCANHGMGLWYLQINETQRLKETVKSQQLHLNALYEVMGSELETEDRKRLYKSKVYQQLDNSVKELVPGVHNYIGGILAFINDSTDEELEAGISDVIMNLCNASAAFEKIWTMFLCCDKDIDEAQWYQNIKILKGKAINVEVFCDVTIPFLVELYDVLSMYKG